MNMRRARAEDAEALWRVHTQAIRESAKSHYTQEQIEAWAGPLTPHSYGSSIAEHPFFVAEDRNGEIVGFSEMRLESSEVRAVYVSPAHERRGIGRKLLQALEEFACRQGLSELRVEASLNAVAFYERAGFQQQCQTAHRIIASGTDIPCVQMRKPIGNP